MAKRSTVSKRKDRRIFANSAKRTKSVNVSARLKRGGFRL